MFWVVVMVIGLYLLIRRERITLYPEPAKTAKSKSKVPCHEILISPSGFVLIIIIPITEITAPKSKFQPILSLLNMCKAMGFTIGNKAIIIAAKLASTKCILKFSPIKYKKGSNKASKKNFDKSVFSIRSNFPINLKTENIRSDAIASLIVRIRKTGKFAFKSSFVQTKLMPQNIIENIMET